MQFGNQEWTARLPADVASQGIIAVLFSLREKKGNTFSWGMEKTHLFIKCFYLSTQSIDFIKIKSMVPMRWKMFLEINYGR